jgi:hypothetical protein
MPNPTIDLQRDCELFVDFDTDYFNSQRNKILDRSGNGRNPEASGGPTLGAQGPDNFEAASFDGADDRFENDEPIAVQGSETLFVIVRPDSFTSGNLQFIAGNLNTSADTGAGLLFFEDKVEYDLRDGTNSPVPVSQSDTQAGQFFFLTGRFDGTQIELFRDGDLVDSNSVTTKSVGTSNFKISRKPGTTTAELDGEIVTVAKWSRALSDAEIEYLNRLTEPRRAQL